MITDFVSSTEAQKKLTKIIQQKPFQMILHNNSLLGMILSAEATKLLASSGILEQIQEELAELQDKELCETVRAAKAQDYSDSEDFTTFRKRYGV
jgi:PHD/YefM family antitoxin component YafN of YafNO toxin-antitoxin module